MENAFLLGGTVLKKDGIAIISALVSPYPVGGGAGGRNSFLFRATLAEAKRQHACCYATLPIYLQIAIVVTDGKQTTTGGYTRLATASGGLKNKGVTVYAVGVGYNVDRDELEEIASSPDYVLTSSSFRALQTVAPQIRKAVCEGEKDFV